MLKIDPNVVVHRLTVDPNFKPVCQKIRSFNSECYRAIEVEVTKLLNVGFIRTLDSNQWLSNVVLVKKKDNKWRMCVDFTDLNRACPKDCFPLPRINQLIDSTSGINL
ncbi:hypothetical protein ACOSQ3_006658 [Xanthoceras sorbifolium]